MEIKLEDIGIHLKGWILCQEEMEQVLAAKGQVQDTDEIYGPKVLVRWR
jgi:hypothetical protein